MKTIEQGTAYNINLVAFISVKRLRIAVFLHSQFFEFKIIQRFQIFGHTIIYFWLKDIFKGFGFLATIFCFSRS